MLNPHLSLAIAQTVFYIPIVPLAMLLMWRNGRIRPRMAWWPLNTFSLIRLVGGIVTIVLEEKPSTSLFIAALVLLDIGTIPLIVTDLGLTRLILRDNFSNSKFYNLLQRLLRFAFIISVVLLGVGAGSTESAIASKVLTLAGFSVFAVVLAVLIALQLFLLPKRPQLTRSSRRTLYSVLAASPFLIVRNVYGFLNVNSNLAMTSRWNPVTGSAVDFFAMALLMEYVVVLIFFYNGFTMPRDRGATEESNQLEGDRQADDFQPQPSK